jgi:hypothetical protein
MSPQGVVRNVRQAVGLFYQAQKPGERISAAGFVSFHFDEMHFKGVRVT